MHSASQKEVCFCCYRRIVEESVDYISRAAGFSGLSFYDFKPIAETIGNVGTPDPRHRLVSDHLDPFRLKVGDQFIVSPGTNCRMCLFCWTEILFHPQMDLHASACEPDPAASRQFRRLWNFPHAENANVELSGPLFFTRRHGELHVIDGRKELHA
jgi:hypothetical protein